MNLLMEYYQPHEGSVRINDIQVHDIGNMNQLVAIMRQDPVLFNDTLRSNLTMYQEIEMKS